MVVFVFFLGLSTLGVSPNEPLPFLLSFAVLFVVVSLVGRMARTFLLRVLARALRDDLAPFVLQKTRMGWYRHELEGVHRNETLNLKAFVRCGVLTRTLAAANAPGLA